MKGDSAKQNNKQLQEERCTKQDRDMAILAVEKLTAVADVKINATEKSMEGEEKSNSFSRRDMNENAKRRTQEWVDAQENT